VVVAASTDPIRTMIRTPSRTCFLLCRSARRPIRGVDAAAASRLAVTAQLTATVEASSCSAMMPRTGTTAVCSTATVSATRPSTAMSSRRGAGDPTAAEERVLSAVGIFRMANYVG
jgi:hypothetical protein